MVEATDTGWEHIPPALAAVARRSGISAAELDAFRDDPANQDAGVPDLDDHDWERILAPTPDMWAGDDGSAWITTGGAPQGAWLAVGQQATEPTDEPGPDDRQRCLARLDALRLRAADLDPDLAPAGHHDTPEPQPADGSPSARPPVDGSPRGTAPAEEPDVDTVAPADDEACPTHDARPTHEARPTHGAAAANDGAVPRDDHRVCGAQTPDRAGVRLTEYGTLPSEGGGQPSVGPLSTRITERPSSPARRFGRELIGRPFADARRALDGPHRRCDPVLATTHPTRAGGTEGPRPDPATATARAPPGPLARDIAERRPVRIDARCLRSGENSGPGRTQVEAGRPR